MIMYVLKIYGTSAVVCLLCIIPLRKHTCFLAGQRLGFFPWIPYMFFVRGSVWTTKEQKCANKIPRQQLLGCLASSTFDGRWHIGPHLPRKYWNCFCGTKDHTSRVRCNHRWPQWAGLGQHSRTVFGLYSYMFCWLGKGIMTPLSGKRGTHHHCVRYPCHLTLPGTIMPPL